MAATNSNVDTQNTNTLQSSSSERQNIEKYNLDIFEQKKLPFTMIPNKVIQNIPANQMKAGFLWVYLQSLPGNWKPNKYHLMKHFDMSESTYKRCMSWLKLSKLIEHYQVRNSDGSFGAFRLVVLDGTEFNLDAELSRGVKNDLPVIDRGVKTPPTGEPARAANEPPYKYNNIKKTKEITKTTADDVLITEKGNSMGATPREIETVQRKIRAKREKGDEITSVEGLAGHIITGLRKGTQKFYEGSQRQQAKLNDDSYSGVPKHYIDRHARPGESYESAAGRLRDSYLKQA